MSEGLYNEIPDDLVTVDGIIKFLKNVVEERKILPPGTWIDAAQKLNVLQGDLDDELVDTQSRIAEEKTRMFEADEKKNVSAVNLRIETTEDWRRAKKLEAKIKRIQEFIRIAKLRAKISLSDMNNQI